MKTYFKISLFVLFALFNYGHIFSLFDAIDETSFNYTTSIAELSYEQPDFSETDCIDSKAFSSSSYANLMLVEEEEEKKKTKKKSTYTAIQKVENTVSLLKLVPAQRAIDRFISSNTALYKIFHTWKIHLL